MSPLRALLAVLLLACAAARAAEGKSEILAELDAPAANGWPDRWKDDVVESTKVVHPTAGTCYASATIKGKLPDSGTVLVRIHYFSEGNDAFTMGIGAWGSPTQEVIPQKKGWQDTYLGFNACVLPGFVKDGKLALVFQKPLAKGAGISRVELFVPSHDELLTAYKTFVKESTEEAWKLAMGGKFTFVDDYDSKEPLNPADEDQKRGAIPFLRSYVKFIYPASVPTKEERLTSAGVQLPPGETVPLQLAIKALKDFPECKAEAAGALPKGLKTDIRWVENVPIRTAGGSTSTKWHVQPNRLWTSDIFPTCAVKANDAQAWYVLISAAADTPAGIFPVSIAIKNGAETILTFTVKVEVLPFKLPKDIGKRFILTEGLMVEDEKIIQDMGEHGLNGVASFNDFQPVLKKAVDFTAWDAYFATLKKHGIDQAFYWYLGNPKSGNAVMGDVGKDDFVKILQGINERVKDGRYPKFFVLSIDEAASSAHAMTQLKELAELIKQHAPLLHCMSASMGSMDNAQKYLGTIDVLATNGAYPESNAWCKKNNVTFTVYTYVAARVKAADTRLDYGIMPWQSDATLMNGWALRWYNGNPFNDLDSTASDWCVIMPNWCGAPISTPSWEGMREGINDQRYLALYEQLVKDGKADGQLLQQLKEKGAGSTTVAKEKVIGDSVFGASANNASDLEIAREKVIAEIVKAVGKK